MEGMLYVYKVQLSSYKPRVTIECYILASATEEMNI